MGNQSSQDLIASGAIVLMFIGAFILPVTSLGLLLIAAGTIAIVLLILKATGKKQ